MLPAQAAANARLLASPLAKHLARLLTRSAKIRARQKANNGTYFLPERL